MLGRLFTSNVAVIVNAVAAAAVLLVVDDVRGGAWVMLAAILVVLWNVRPIQIGLGFVDRTPDGRPRVRVRLGTFAVSRSLAAVLVDLLDDSVVGRVVAGALIAEVLVESVLGRVRRAAAPVTAHAPWAPEPRERRVAHLIAPVAVVGTGLAVLLVALGVSTWPVLGLVLLALAFAVAEGIGAIRARNVGKRALAGLRAGLEEYEPRFVLYWEAGPNTLYQVGMWLPFLEQLGERFVVVLRHPRNLRAVAELTDSPVVVVRAMEGLDDVVVPSIRTAFYVNNSIRNCHFVRYTEITHVQLNHGDSDKAPSYNPVMRMYDLNFVAGQAAVDRYAAHGVLTRDDFFRIVGRPQVADVAPASARPADAALTVLYAPTWAGFMADSNCSSLLQGPDIIRELLRREVTVVFRPHPHAWRAPDLAAAGREIERLLADDAAASGRAHLFGKVAAEEMTVVDCFNAADAMISDVSSVVPDFLFSGKPFALVAVGLTTEEFVVENPIAHGAYVIDESLENLGQCLDNLLGADPVKEERLRMRTAYLGDTEREDYVEIFMQAAREVVSGA